MRHPALRRSARHSGKRGPRDADQKVGNPAGAGASGFPDPSASNHPDPANQNRPAPGVPPDGEHNQGGARAEGIDYQRDLGSEQDA
ncbi:hypothetical protein [Paraburkholderia bannensis]|uniref:hypothetical protein n=1 Tax=Paraburkholderia bannensis TaxID=765414 RepID=UPI0004886CC4|nr:hypothetical protein [Paraburkholderia bannensis]